MARNTKNWNCEGENCKDPNSEVRLLPTGGDGNSILCYQCYLHEVEYRIGRRAEGIDCEIPAWESLTRYETAA